MAQGGFEVNAVAITAYNNLELTQKAVESVCKQDIPVDLWLINNGSTDGTQEWFEWFAYKTDISVQIVREEKNRSPIALANEVLPEIFKKHDYVLGVCNDTAIPTNLYSQLLRFPRGMVAAHMDCPVEDPPPCIAKMIHEDPHFSVMLLRKWAHDAIKEAYGSYYDERYFMYASDCDLKMRMREVGIRGCQTDIQCWHWGSAAWRHPSVPESERREMLAQADLDRDTFKLIWGFAIGSEEYDRRIRG